jgi:hypothetical protein
MSGDDRRTALLGRLKKVRELIASFFRAFTQDGVRHACLRSNRTAPYRIRQSSDRPERRHSIRARLPVPLSQFILFAHK